MKDNNLEVAINKSRSILALPDDWDGEGGKAPSEETWKRATDFVRQMAETFYDQLGGHTFFPPSIRPGPHGSIDVHWKQQGYELLINFPASANEPPDCYGEDSHKVPIKRILDDPQDYIAMARWIRYA